MGGKRIVICSMSKPFVRGVNDNNREVMIIYFYLRLKSAKM